MRVIAFGKFRSWISFFLHGVIEGTIRNGWQIDRVELENPCSDRVLGAHIRSIKERLVRMKPHYIFCHSIFGEDDEYYPGLFDVLRDVKKEFGTKIALHVGDPRPTLRYPHDISDIVDICLVNTDLDHYATLCHTVYKVPSYFWPFACWQTNNIYYTTMKYDMIFLGYMSRHERYVKRTEFVRKCQRNKVLNLRILNEEMGRTHFYNKDLALTAAGVLAVPSPEYEEYSLDARLFIFGGYGGVVFAKRTALAERIFADREHIIFFDDIDNPKELARLFEEYGDNRKIRNNAFTYIQECHNYENRVSDAIDALEGRLNKPRVYLEDF